MLHFFYAIFIQEFQLEQSPFICLCNDQEIESTLPVLLLASKLNITFIKSLSHEIMVTVRHVKLQSNIRI